MAQIIQFPTTSNYAPLRVRGRGRGTLHSIRVQITDRRQPEESRWHAQWAVQRGASCRALEGFNDMLARRGGWHSFKIRAGLLRRFLLDVEKLVARGRMAVEVDGRLIRIAKSA